MRHAMRNTIGFGYPRPCCRLNRCPEELSEATTTSPRGTWLIRSQGSLRSQTTAGSECLCSFEVGSVMLGGRLQRGCPPGTPLHTALWGYLVYFGDTAGSRRNSWHVCNNFWAGSSSRDFVRIVSLLALGVHSHGGEGRRWGS